MKKEDIAYDSKEKMVEALLEASLTNLETVVILQTAIEVTKGGKVPSKDELIKFLELVLESTRECGLIINATGATITS